MKRNFLYILLFSIVFSACSTDLDVKGDWQETMVVYGLLDQSQNKQYIKINKAFLGEGDAFAFAQAKDSTQFSKALNVKLVRMSDGSEFNLAPDNTIPKDAGVFYAPDQANAIYSFNSTGAAALSFGNTYKLVVRNSDTGKEVSASTKLVNDFGSYNTPSPVSSSFGFIVPNNDNFKFIVKWQSAANAKVYQLIFRFHYTDSTTTGNIAQYVDKVFTETKTLGLAGGENIEYSIVGQDYLQFIASKLSDYNGLVKRTPGLLEIITIAAGEELSTFIDVNKPSTGIVQEKPEYTNISGGLGVFSSRYYKAPFARPFSKSTLDSLSGGFRTCHLKFTNNLGVWPGCI